MDLYNLIVSAKISKGGGGGDEPVLIDKSIDANGTYKASDDSADGYKKVIVSVPSSGIVPSGTKNISSNGLYDVTNFSQASVSVPGVVPSGTSSITANGIYDITSFASVDVNVSGGGGDHDAEDGIVTRRISGAYYNDRVTSIGPSAFYGCSSLATASFPKVTSIGSNAFRSCRSLASIYFLAASVVNLYDANAFYATPVSSSTYTGSFGSIYVPASLVDSYKTSTNWSVYAARITSYVE